MHSAHHGKKHRHMGRHHKQLLQTGSNSDTDDIISDDDDDDSVSIEEVDPKSNAQKNDSNQQESFNK